MSNAYLCPLIQDPQFKDDSTFLYGGLVWFYEAGTTTPQTVYQDQNASVAWPNPIVLNARGETGGEIWLSEGKSYKIILESEPLAGLTHGTTISTFDNIYGINDPSSNPETANWQQYYATPSYITATSFSFSGIDATSVFTPNRRVKAICADNTPQYGTVKTSVYTSSIPTSTTVTLIMDQGNALDSGLSIVNYGFIETQPSSIAPAVLTGTSTTSTNHNIKVGYDGTWLTSTVDNTDFGSNWPINITGAAGPTGSIIMFAASTPPVGYLAANGAQVSRTTYAQLFSVIGTTFGAGDGSATFNLPDLRGYFMRGWDSAGTVDSNTSTQSGTTASSSTTITGLTDTTYLVVGMSVTGSGIPSSTTIASIVSGTSITISNAATASATVTLTFSGRIFGSIQDDDNKAHTHTSDHAHAASNAQSFGPLRTDGAVSAVTGWILPGQGGTSHLTTDTNSANIGNTGTESRPKNIALLACIKY